VFDPAFGDGSSEPALRHVQIFDRLVEVEQLINWS
jgi:hypothetical protein